MSKRNRFGITTRKRTQMSGKFQREKHMRFAQMNRYWTVSKTRLLAGDELCWMDDRFRGQHVKCAGAVEAAKAWIAEGRRSPIYLVLVVDKRVKHCNLFDRDHVDVGNTQRDEVTRIVRERLEGKILLTYKEHFNSDGDEVRDEIHALIAGTHVWNGRNPTSSEIPSLRLMLLYEDGVPGNVNDSPIFTIHQWLVDAPTTAQALIDRVTTRYEVLQ